MEGPDVMKPVISMLALCVALAACGVDGEPERPPQPQPDQPPPQVSGAVTITNNGVYPSVAVSQGWFSLYLGRWW